MWVESVRLQRLGFAVREGSRDRARLEGYPRQYSTKDKAFRIRCYDVGRVGFLCVKLLYIATSTGYSPTAHRQGVGVGGQRIGSRAWPCGLSCCGRAVPRQVDGRRRHHHRLQRATHVQNGPEQTTTYPA